MDYTNLDGDSSYDKKMEYNPQNLKIVLSKYLAQHGLSPEQYAEMCGVNNRTIRYILEGKEVDNRMSITQRLLEPMGIKLEMVGDIEFLLKK